MKVTVFSSKKALLGKLSALEKTRLFDYSVKNPDEVRDWISTTSGNALAYLDISQFTDREVGYLLRLSHENKRVFFGILDHLGGVDDPARFFHLGAVDYIGKKLLFQGLSCARVKMAIDTCVYQETESDGSAAMQEDWKLSGRDWKGVRSGQEYTFCFMFVEIDLLNEWKKKSGQTHLDAVKETFQIHMERFANTLSGKIWMWTDLGGLILFPFDGARCDIILESIRLVLNRTIISAEVYRYHTDITYRIVLHIGNTIYRSRGNTGTIVSNSVNFLFHLGNKFAESGNLYLTEPVRRFIPDGFKDCFVPVDTFEGVPIIRMRIPSN